MKDVRMSIDRLLNTESICYNTYVNKIKYQNKFISVNNSGTGDIGSVRNRI